MTRRQFDRDLYKVLGVDATVTPEALKQAYRRRAMEEHPDLKQDAAEKEAATVRFQEVNEAYEILSDPEKRDAYDRSREMTESYSGYWDQQAYETYTNDDAFENAVENFEEWWQVKKQAEQQETFHKYRYKWEFGFDERTYKPDALLFITPDKSENIEKDWFNVLKHLQRYGIEYDYFKCQEDENRDLQILSAGEGSESIYITGNRNVERLQDLIGESYNPFEKISSIVVSENPPAEEAVAGWRQGLKKKTAAFATAVSVAALGFCGTQWLGNHLRQSPSPSPSLPDQEKVLNQKAQAIQTTLAALDTYGQRAPSLEQLQRFGGVALGKKGLRSLHAPVGETIDAAKKTFGMNFKSAKEVKKFIVQNTDKKYRELDKIRNVVPGKTWSEFDKVANAFPGENVFQKGKEQYEQELEQVEMQQEQKKSTLLQKFSAIGFSVVDTLSNSWRHLQEQSASLWQQRWQRS